MRALARGLGRAILLLVQMVYALLLAVFVPMLALAILGENSAHAPHWVSAAGLGFWIACILVASSWVGRARRRARAARWTPPPSPPGQPMPEPVPQQWPEVAGYAIVRRLPDGSVVIEPARGQNVA